MMMKEDMLVELEILQNSLKRRKSDIEAGVDSMEEGKKVRDDEKKKLLLKQMKQILIKLEEIDKKVVNDLKGEAFDYLRSAGKLTQEIATVQDALENGPNRRNWANEVNNLKAKVENLRLDEFVQCLDISVSIQPGSMIAVFEEISDAIYLETSALKPQDYSLLVTEEHGRGQTKESVQNNYIDVHINFIGETAPTFSPLLFRKLMLLVTCFVPGEGIKVVEECSVWNKMETKKAILSKNGDCITVQLKRQRSSVCKISFKLLGSNIVNSPILHQFYQGDHVGAVGNQTVGNDTLGVGVFDVTGLDQSDMNCLDMTARRQMNGISKPAFQPSEVDPHFRNLANPPNGSWVMNPAGKLNSSVLPFSPCSEGVVSTMRQTAAASQLAGALHHLARQEGIESSAAVPEDRDESILAPSRNSALSIDDMQRSLSGSESGGDKSVLMMDKSVSFAPRTQVVEILSTPQVLAGSSRYNVSHGQTKSRDGQAGIGVRRLDKGENPYESEKKASNVDIWDVVDEEVTPASAVTLPLVASVNHPALYCLSRCLDSFQDEDPHLMLNASKAPSPQSSWPKEDSIWDQVSDCEDDEDNYSDPHLMLNASKAPQAGADWPIVDSACDSNQSLLPDSRNISRIPDSCNISLLPDSCNVSLLPESRFDEDPHMMLNASKAPPVGVDWSREDSIWDWGFEQSPPRIIQQTQDNNQTIWDTEQDFHSHPQVRFDLIRGSFQQTTVYESQPITESTSRGTTHSLVSPHSIAYFPHIHCFLVTEPSENRVGLYKAETFEFDGWLIYPSISHSRRHYNHPTSLLCLANGFPVLIERNRLHVFDENFTFFHSIKGVFHGLTEGPRGEIFTLGEKTDGSTIVKKFIRTRFRYKFVAQFLLTVQKEFKNWKTLSKPRFILYCNDKIFITDPGLHKLYILNLTSRKQMAQGYLGSNPGQFKSPTGLLTDNMGNLLVADSDNNRLLVFTEDGKFVKMVGQVDWRFSSPQGLLRQGNSVLAVCKGEMGQGAIVRYRVDTLDSGLNTPETGSEDGVYLHANSN